MAIKTRASFTNKGVPTADEPSPVDHRSSSLCELVNQAGFDSDVIFGETQTRRRIESASVPEKANGREADFTATWIAFAETRSTQSPYS